MPPGADASARRLGRRDFLAGLAALHARPRNDPRGARIDGTLWMNERGGYEFRARREFRIDPGLAERNRLVNGWYGP